MTWGKGGGCDSKWPPNFPTSHKSKHLNKLSPPSVEGTPAAFRCCLRMFLADLPPPPRTAIAVLSRKLSRKLSRQTSSWLVSLCFPGFETNHPVIGAEQKLTARWLLAGIPALSAPST